MARSRASPMTDLRPVKSVGKAKRTNAKQEPGDPYANGYEAALAGSPETFNPYDPGTRDFTLWRDGWRTSLEEAIA